MGDVTNKLGVSVKEVSLEKMFVAAAVAVKDACVSRCIPVEDIEGKFRLFMQGSHCIQLSPLFNFMKIFPTEEIIYFKRYSRAKSKPLSYFFRFKRKRNDKRVAL